MKQKYLKGGSLVVRTLTGKRRQQIPEGVIRLKLRYKVDGSDEEAVGWFSMPLAEYRQLLNSRSADD